MALRTVQCRHDGCSKKLNFGNLQQHETEECEYLPIDCKYKILGCSWKGLRQNQEEHEFKCEIDQDDSLEIVQEISDQLTVYQKFCNLCTNINTSPFDPSEHDTTSFEEELKHESDEFFYDGYEYTIRIKSEKRKVRRNSMYQLKAQIVFADEPTQIAFADHDHVKVGIMIEQRGCLQFKLIKEMDFHLSTSVTESEWFTFDTELNEEEYVRLHSG